MDYTSLTLGGHLLARALDEVAHGASPRHGVSNAGRRDGIDEAGFPGICNKHENNTSLILVQPALLKK